MCRSGFGARRLAERCRSGHPAVSAHLTAARPVAAARVAARSRGEKGASLSCSAPAGCLCWWGLADAGQEGGVGGVEFWSPQISEKHLKLFPTFPSPRWMQCRRICVPADVVHPGARDVRCDIVPCLLHAAAAGTRTAPVWGGGGAPGPRGAPCGVR